MTRLRLSASLVALLILVPCGPASAAKLYKWVDENGNVTYSQQRAPGVAADSMEIKSQGPSDSEAATQLEQLNETASEASKDRQFAATAADELKAREERLKKNCATARENKRILDSARRVQATGEDGMPYFLDDATRQERIAKSEEQIRQFCQ